MNEINIFNEDLWCYSLISEVCYNSDIGEYQTYGITVTSSEHTQTIHDISVCKDDVKQMIRLFTEYRLSPIHFEDAVEDMIGDFII